MNFAKLLKTLFCAKHLWATASEMKVLRNNMHSFKRSDDKFKNKEPCLLLFEEEKRQFVRIHLLMENRLNGEFY